MLGMSLFTFVSVLYRFVFLYFVCKNVVSKYILLILFVYYAEMFFYCFMSHIYFYPVRAQGRR